MAQQFIPEALVYSTVRPPGIPSRITTIRYNSSNPSSILNPGDTVRFDINSTGFWDPYIAYFNIDVSFKNGEDNVIYQLDGSAHSFFRYMVIYNRGTEIERIMDYDLVASMLTDVQYPYYKRSTHAMEGIGYANFSNQNFGKVEGGLGWKTSKIALFHPLAPSATASKLFKDTMGTDYGIWPTQEIFSEITDYPLDVTLIAGVNGTPKTAGNFTTTTEHFRFPIANVTETQLYDGKYAPPLLMNTEHFNDYLSTANLKIAQTSFGEVLYAPAAKYIVDSSKDFRIQTVSEISGVGRTFGPGENIGKNLFRSNGFYGIDILTDADVQGGGTWKQVFNASLSNACFEPQFTNGKYAYYNPAVGPPSEANLSFYFENKQPLGWQMAPIELQYAAPIISSGQFLRIPRNSGSFSVPILSGFLGVLMPSTSYRLIPMAAFPNITIEMQLSPWAVFTSGYCNTNTNSKMNCPDRRYEITRLELVSCQYIFPPDVEAIIMGQYRSGATIYLHTQSFTQGPIVSVPNNQVPGTVQCNNGMDSCCGVTCIFICDDYKEVSYGRRTFRCSMCITKFQLKMGMEYYPSLPSLSNGGNVSVLTENSNYMGKRPNNEYLMALFCMFNIYNNLNRDCFIDNTNFSVNGPCYDRFNSLANSLANPDRLGLPYQAISCQYGAPLLHENRCVGKAIYAVDLQTFNADQKVLSGVNTMGIKPFEIIFEYQADALSIFKGMATLYTFFWFDMLLATNLTGVAVIGKA